MLQLICSLTVISTILYSALSAHINKFSLTSAKADETITLSVTESSRSVYLFFAMLYDFNSFRN